MWMYLTVDAAVLDVIENLLLEKIVAVLVELIRGGNQLRQPVRCLLHPAAFAALERWVALFRARILDAEPVEGGAQPFAAIDLVHADGGAKLVRQFGQGSITPAQQ